MGEVLWLWGLAAVAARHSLVDELEHDLLHLALVHGTGDVGLLRVLVDLAVGAQLLLIRV